MFKFSIQLELDRNSTCIIWFPTSLKLTYLALSTAFDIIDYSLAYMPNIPGFPSISLFTLSGSLASALSSIWPLRLHLPRAPFWLSFYILPLTVSSTLWLQLQPKRYNSHMFSSWAKLQTPIFNCLKLYLDISNVSQAQHVKSHIYKRFFLLIHKPQTSSKVYLLIPSVIYSFIYLFLNSTNMQLV